MPKTSQFDEPIAFDANGEPDLWDSDTIEGRARIQKRIAEARGAEVALSSGSLTARVDAAIAERFKKQKAANAKLVQMLAETVAELFAEEREKHCAAIEDAMLDGRARLVAMAETAQRLERDVENCWSRRR